STPLHLSTLPLHAALPIYGLSLAWACAAHIAAKIRAFTLFATHYFELTSLAGETPGVANVHVEAVEHGDKLVFLHSVKEGPANRSEEHTSELQSPDHLVCR